MDNAVKSPCWQQRQVAAQNSFFATIALGREIVYKAPCDVDKAAPPAARPQPPAAASIDPERARRTG